MSASFFSDMLQTVSEHGRALIDKSRSGASLVRVAALVRRHGVPVHIDGARICNAAVALEVGADVVAEPADTVMFCISKGLSAPVAHLRMHRYEFCNC